jgi:hypothetical protein
MRKFLALAAVLIFLSFGSIAYAAGDQEEGLAVKNWKGDYVGSVRHVLTDPSSGNIIFLILSLGKGEEKEIVVPVRSFSSYDYENGFLVLNVSKEILTEAPEFHVSDLKDPAFMERVYRFFGLVPSWKDGTTEGERKS